MTATIAATINDSATGKSRADIGRTVEVVRPGANSKHVICRWPGERHEFGFPSRWLTYPAPEPFTARGLRTKRSMFA